jgi:hypothetical protein
VPIHVVKQILLYQAFTNLHPYGTFYVLFNHCRSQEQNEYGPGSGFGYAKLLSLPGIQGGTRAHVKCCQSGENSEIA